MISAEQALQRLREGNERFVSGASLHDPGLVESRRAELLEGQSPFAVILGCSDSRVPAEHVFDQGLGDLFVVRVAGNLAAPTQIGSVEFAVEHLGARLVVVLGHTHCGAVSAALDDLQGAGPAMSSHLRSIVDRIQPALRPVLAAGSARDPAALARQAVRANVLAAVQKLRSDSAVMQQFARKEGLVIAGAEYALETGAVEFLEALVTRR